MRVGDASEEIDPIRAESTASLIARRLREAIARGHFKQGQQLIEAELSKRLQVSRGVLREAMQRLTQEGLLVGRPNRGVFVAELGREEIFDIYTARLAIERAACLKVIDVTRRTDVMADALDRLSDVLEERAASGSDVDEVVRLDIEFHERMVAEAHSPRLNRMYDTLATESRMCLSAFESRAYPVADRIVEHRAIAQAIRDRDVPLLHRLLAEHMDHAVEMILHRFAEELDE
jgi:DNA-binding GntR family transcriptional regulator